MPDAAANYRMLHTMIRVMDLDKSLAFYTGPMGMKLLRKRDRLCPVARLPHNSDVALWLNDGGHGLPDQGLIVDDEY